MSVDLIHLWGTMGWFAKGVVIIMAFMSIWSLTIMIQKFFQFQRSQSETRKFAPQFSRAIQEGNLDQLIWKVPEVIAQLSTLFELAAGDLIFTGTPSGVGAVRRGEAMEGAVEGVGSLSLRVI